MENPRGSNQPRMVRHQNQIQATATQNHLLLAVSRNDFLANHELHEIGFCQQQKNLDQSRDHS